MPLMFSVSGLRGIVGVDLGPEIIVMYARAFGTFLSPGTVVIGRDTRRSGTIFRRAVIHGLNAAGCTVVDLGIVPTPTVLFMVRELRANGGIVITASHNPEQWNALKFVTRRGQFLDAQEFKKFSKLLNRAKISKQLSKNTFKTKKISRGINEHTNKIISILKMPSVKLKIGVDAVNGAGSIALPMLLEKLDCLVYRLNCKFRPNFPRRPEPTSENIKVLCQLVKKNGLDLGFAVDPDCDRLSIVDENGRAIGEENTLVLATDYMLSKFAGNVVTNLSTTTLMNDIVRKYNCRLYRTKVGEANVVSKMEAVKAIIGGEGNGGVIYPRINFTRDALVGAAIVLKLVVERNMLISQILAQYPKYYIIKEKIKADKKRFDKKKRQIIRAFEGKINLTDGLKITGHDYWLHIRPSQTESLIRIIGEAGNKAKIEKYIKKIEAMLI